MTPAPPHAPRSGSTRPPAARALLGLLLALLAAIWLGGRALEVNLRHACREAQWPGLVRCDASGSATAEPARLQQEMAQLQARLQHNPGDAWALTRMVHVSRLLGQDKPALLSAAAQLAPHRPEVLGQQAGQALARRDWGAAVPALVLLATVHSDAEATRALARLVALAPQDAGLMARLQVALQQSPVWLDKALRTVVTEQLPMAAAMPLVSSLALAGALEPDTGLLVIRQLKREGRWLDAHAVWLQLWQGPLGLLFNGDFEQSFVKDGFDWNLPQDDTPRAGAQADRVGRGERGQVLRIRFTGRPFQLPLVHQDLLLPEGTYRLQGEHQSTDLRSEAGLAWVLTCADGARELARTGPLGATGREWRRFERELTVPSSCQGLTLGLQVQAPYEARTGLRGEVLFDKLRLSRVGTP